MSRPLPLRVQWLPGRLAVWRAEPGDPAIGRIVDILDARRAAASAATTASTHDATAPPAAGTLVCVAATPEELSIVCDEAMVPAGARAERGFAALQVCGTLDMGLVGILRSITVPLADAGVAVFAISTFDTDYVLVRAGDAATATAALRAAGHTVESATAVSDRGLPTPNS